MTLKDHRWYLVALLACIAASFITEGWAAQDSKPRQPGDRGLAAIVDSGSTNGNGFRILVERSGRTQLAVVPRNAGSQPAEVPVTTFGTIPAALAQRLYSDLDAARPISSLPLQHCPKSASFGTTLTIEFEGQTTPDLSCGDGANPKMRALVEDTQQIVNASRKQQTSGR